MHGLARTAWVIAVALVACGGGDKPFPLDTLAGQALVAHCERAVRCGLYDNVGDCGSDLHIDDFPILPKIVHFQDPAVIASVGSGAMSYDQDVAAGCIAALAAVSCSRASEDVRVDDPAACDGLFTGHIAEAGPCVFDDECASGRCTPAASCENDYVCCIGACATAPHTAGIGSACAIDSDCAVDAFCTGAGCMPLLAVGDVCSTSSECAFDLRVRVADAGRVGRVPGRAAARRCMQARRVRRDRCGVRIWRDVYRGRAGRRGVRDRPRLRRGSRMQRRRHVRARAGARQSVLGAVSARLVVQQPRRLRRNV